MSTERDHRGVVPALILAGYLLLLIDVSILMAALPRIHDAAGSATDGPRALLAERVSAALTVACLFLVLALVVTVLSRPRTRAAAADETRRASPVPIA